MSTGDIYSLDPNFNGIINIPVNNVSVPDLNVQIVFWLIGQTFSVSGHLMLLCLSLTSSQTLTL